MGNICQLFLVKESHSSNEKTAMKEHLRLGRKLRFFTVPTSGLFFFLFTVSPPFGGMCSVNRESGVKFLRIKNILGKWFH